MTSGRVLFLDNNCFNRLASAKARQQLRANLRATGREYWPTAINVLEAMKTRDRDKRTHLLTVISEIAGDHLALTMPGEALRRIAVAVARNASFVNWSEPRITRLFRDPESVTDEDVAETRNYFFAQERTFDDTHQKVRSALKLHAKGAAWNSLVAFIDDLWTDPKNLGPYIEGVWGDWKLPGSAPIDVLLKHEAWRLYFDGWGASLYARSVEHPQPGWVESSDLLQLIYLGVTHDRVLATDDPNFCKLGNAILRDRYQLAEMVPLDMLIA